MMPTPTHDPANRRAPTAARRRAGLSGALVLVTAFAVVGCVETDINRFLSTDAAAATGSAFDRALAEQYQEATQTEALAAGNWTDAHAFALKGLAALRGDTPTPSDPTALSVGSDALMDELVRARGQLVTAINNNAGPNSPNIAACAKAQRHYDAWVEAASDNDLSGGGSYLGGKGGAIQPDSTRLESQDFSEALRACGGRFIAVAPPTTQQLPTAAAAPTTAAPTTGGTAAATATTPIPIVRAQLPSIPSIRAPTSGATAGILITLPPVRVLSYFAFDSVKLSPESVAIANQTANLVEDYREHQIEITGHTDTIGPKTYNQALGLRRADAMRKALENRGVRNITTRSVGETELSVPTGDEVREPLNRRAVVIVTGAK